MIRFFDRKFTTNKTRYLLQCSLAAFTVLVLLVVLDAGRNSAVIAALGASAFISFTMPNARSSGPRFLVGGYLAGILSGFLCHHIGTLPFWESVGMTADLSRVAFGAISVGLAILLMVVADLEHPPAASVALGLVLNNCEPRTMLVVFAGIASLALMKTVMRRFLIDLL